MKKIIILVAGLIPGILLYSQNYNKADSLRKLLTREKTDTGRIVLSYRLAFELQYSDPEQSEKIALQTLEESGRLKFQKGIGNSLIQLGNLEQIKGNNDKAEEYNLKALKILEKEEIKEGLAVCYNNLGILAHNRNDYSIAREYYNKSLAINRLTGRKSGEATSLFCIGGLFENQAKFDSALHYYLKAQEISEAIYDQKLIAYGKISLANVYFRMDNYRLSMKYNEEAVDIYSKLNNSFGLLKTYLALGQTAEMSDSIPLAIWFYKQAGKFAELLDSQGDEATISFYLGQLYENSGKTDSAKMNYRKACELYRLTDSRENVALTLVALARLANYDYDFNAARKMLEEALSIADELNSAKAAVDIFRELSMTYSGLKDFRKAFRYLNRSSELKDSLMTVEKQRQIIELQTQYETDKKEKENVILRKDRQILQTTRNSLIIGALLLTIIIIVVFRSLTIKKRDNRILKEQKEEINRQKEIVESQKTSITDSIRYAKRIQSAMLTPDDVVKQNLPDSFVLYLPRDIVSGDFYWMRKVDESKVIICVADCTGHGVPGAFMSMLGMSLLNDIISVNNTLIIKNEFKPSDILNELRERIKASLRQTGREGEARDGMDLSLCLIDNEARLIRYSGANNPIYMVIGGSLAELKATRNPVGIYLNEVSFADQQTDLIPGTMIYMFSDGYSDQLGEDGSKFLSKNFKKMLSEISHEPVNEIREMLLSRHLAWRGREEQVDDILVVGYRV
jgi:serine phosphatase RsbU (regulator of sigma subunit)